METKPDAATWLDQLTSSIENASLRSPFGDPLPRFPPADLQASTTGLSGAAALAPAAAFHADIVDTMDRIGAKATPDWRVVDFGSGWGRITRFFLRETRLANISGLDVDPQFVALSNQLFGADIFHVCTPMPPSRLASGSVNLVTAFSVFSHLSEAACRQWIDEFARVLKPGGLFAFTTRSEWFIDFCSQIPADTPVGHMRVLRTLFADWEDARRRFRAGEFVHTATGGGGVRDSSYYGESFIPRSYIEREYSRDFELVMASETPQPGSARRAIADRNAEYDQALFILRRR